MKRRGAGSLSVIGFFSSLPDLALGAAFLLTWLMPRALGARAVAGLMGALLLEFVVIHSSGFMGIIWLWEKRRAERILTLLGIGVFYSLFAAGLSVRFGSWWLFGGFWMLTANKMLGVLAGMEPRERELELLQHGWAGALALYVLALCLTLMVPLPALGLTPDVLAPQHLPGAHLPWTNEPQQVIAAGYLYFTSVAVSEMTDFAWVFRWMANAGRRIAGTRG